MKIKLYNLDLEKLVEEATQEALGDVLPDERLLQKKKSAQMRGFKASKKSKKSPEKDVDEAEVEDSQNTKQSLKEPVSPKKSELPEITLGRIVDKLNSIRAGQSLKDKKTQKELNDYFTRLNGNERIALYAFLSGLEKIMGTTGDEAVGDKVKTPHKSPYKIQMKKDAPKVDKTPPAGEESPIVVGEHADKSRELKLLRRNR